MKNLILFVSILLLCHSCTRTLLDDYLEPPEVDPAMAIHVFCTDRSTKIGARLIISYSSFEYYDSVQWFQGTRQAVDAELDVRLYTNGDEVGTFELDTASQDHFFTHSLSLTDQVMEPGTVLELIGEHPVYGAIRSQQIMPQKVPLTQIKFIGNVGAFDKNIPYLFGKDLHAVKVTFQDPPEKNYYQVSVFEDSTEIDQETGDTVVSRGTRWRFIEIDDPSFNTRLYTTYFFSDESFNGKEFSFILKLVDEITPRTKIVFRNLTEEWYRYEISHIAFRKPYDDIEVSTALLDAYVQPSAVEGNIEGAYGVFGVGTEGWYEIER